MCIVLSTLLTLLSLVVLFRRRLKSVVDVLKGIRSEGFTQSRWNLFWVIGRLYVVMVRVVLSLPLSPGIGGFSRICMVFQVGL